MPQIYQISDTLNEILASANETGFLTPEDRWVLRTALLNESLDLESRLIINRLLHSVRRGWIKLSRERWAAA